MWPMRVLKLLLGFCSIPPFRFSLIIFLLVGVTGEANDPMEYAVLDRQVFQDFPQYCNTSLSLDKREVLYQELKSRCLSGSGDISMEESYFSHAWINYRSTFLIERGQVLRPQITSNSTNGTTFDHINKINFKNFFDKMQVSHATINVLVFGGSFTAGAQIGGKTKSWPRMLQNILNNEIYESMKNTTSQPPDPMIPNPVHKRLATFMISNHAEGGTTCWWAIRRLFSLMPAKKMFDLVIVDYDVNDCVTMEDTDEARMKLQSCTEALVRRVLMHPSNPALMFLNTATTHHWEMKNDAKCWNWGRCWSLGEVRLPVLRGYGVPIISTKTALWSNFTCDVPKHLWPCTRFCSHPQAPAHRLTAQLIEGFLRGTSFFPAWNSGDLMVVPHPYLQRLNVDEAFVARHNTSSRVVVSEMLSGVGVGGRYLLNHTQELDRDHCHKPLTVVDGPEALRRVRGAVVTSSASFNASSKCWAYMEDVPGKPGWINEDCLGASIYVPVRFGRVPKYTISVLQTYGSSWGVVETALSVDPLDAATLAAARWDNVSLTDWRPTIDGVNGYESKYSLTVAFTFISDLSTVHPNYVHSVFYEPGELQPHSTYLLRIRAIPAPKGDRDYPQKFKLISIDSC